MFNRSYVKSLKDLIHKNHYQFDATNFEFFIIWGGDLKPTHVIV